MIAEEFTYNYEPTSSIPKGTTLSHILQTIKESSLCFKLALTNPKLLKPLNENKLTQILIEQINALLLESGVPILAQAQYNYVFLKSKGIPDIYFHKVEKGKTHDPLFIVEAKILPSPPPKEREREYVIGTKNNGGIQRFKTEKHGQGLSECGLIGFIQSEDYSYWVATINSWIESLSISVLGWSKDEILKELEKTSDFMYLNSTVHISSSEKKLLHHFWMLHD